MAKTRQRDIAQEISELIIAKIASGVMPWRRPWSVSGGGGRPLRHSGEAYTGINTIYLWAIADAMGYRSRYWMTYKQAEALGGQVRRGERASISVYYSRFDKTETDRITGEESVRSIRFLRSYSVFNGDQIDKLPAWYHPDSFRADPPSPSVRQAAIDAFFSPIPIEVRHGGNRAYYNPSDDNVQMPPRHAFKSSDHYASTLGHELTHATGAAHRLARNFGKRFGDNAYAFEELVGDMGAGIICSELGLPAELHDSHASYIDHWVKVLKADSSAIIHAASKAEQAWRWLRAFSDGPEAQDPDMPAEAETA